MLLQNTTLVVQIIPRQCLSHCDKGFMEHFTQLLPVVHDPAAKTEKVTSTL